MASANEELVGAAKSGDVAEIERQIAAGADPNADAGHGPGHPLRAAAENGHVAAIAALLKAGARVDGADSYGRTPLMFAAACGHTAAVDALVAAGADVHHADNGGNTALHRASANGRLDAARVLLEAGAKADVRNLFRKRPIDVVRALSRSLVAAARSR
jgi:ankyrin repeat protein